MVEHSLKTFGGRVSGYLNHLRDYLNLQEKSFKMVHGRKLSSIECHDIVCKTVEWLLLVVSEEVNLLISLSNLSDDRMRVDKIWSMVDEDNGQRGS